MDQYTFDFKTETSIVPVPEPKVPQVEESAAVAAPVVFSVSELNTKIRGLIEGSFPLVWVKAEISNFKPHTSGHFYFCLKDSKSQINAVMFKTFNHRLKFRPQDGMEVMVRGRVTVYEPRGNYQMFCEIMEPVGFGALQLAFEQLKEKLKKEGLFDAQKKRPLPSLPSHVVIVTSPTGAAIRDMLNVLGRRFRGLQITLVPAKVQGDQAPAEIVEAIRLGNKIPDADVMIVGRGGGSIEDLWAFNDERVARAIAASRLPVISAVGHEVDFTIADFVADLRAPTPSAAAELVVRNAAEIIERLGLDERRLRLAMIRRFSELRSRIELREERLIDPQRRLQQMALRCDDLFERMQLCLNRQFRDAKHKVEVFRQRLGDPKNALALKGERILQYEKRLALRIRGHLDFALEKVGRQMSLLQSLSPLQVLDRGYAIARDKKGQVVRDANGVMPNEEMTVRLAKGTLRVLNLGQDGDGEGE